MSNPREQQVDDLENEVVALTIAFGGGVFGRKIAEQIAASRRGAEFIVPRTMFATSPSECVGYPELAIAG